MDKIKKIFQSLAQSIAKLNKLSLPAVILIASIVLGGFYYATEINKQRSIERQQEIKLANDKRIEHNKYLTEVVNNRGKSRCVSEAELSAEDQYKTTCSYGCKKGYYYIANYDSYYKTCLQREGLE